MRTPDPLHVHELAELARYERIMRLALVPAFGLLGVWALVLAVAGDAPWAPATAVLFASPIVLLAFRAQLGRPCPRCSSRIPLGAGFRLPARCRTCGVALRAD